MQVTFRTKQLGEFDNRFKPPTLEASEQGIEEVKYLATTGVCGLVTIQATSPVRSGLLEFIAAFKPP